MKALIALDDSAHAERTLAAVGRWANTWGIEVHLLRVLKPRDIHETAAPRNFTHSLTPAGTLSGQTLSATEPLPILAETRGQASTRMESETQEELAALAKKYLPLAGATAHVEVADDVPERIMGKAADLGVDLIVMGTHGRTGLSHVLVGSVAESVIRQAPVPVLVVGPHASGPA